MSLSAPAPNILATENISKLIWKYSIPSIIGTVVMSFYNIADRIFIGQGVGPLAISGIALTFPFMILLMAFGMLVGAGSASRISITLGENNIEKAEKILANAFILTFIISGTVIILSYIFMSDLLKLFGGSDLTIKYAEDYMRIIIPGGILSALNFGFNNIMRATGYPGKAMYTMIICSVINVVLDPIFIFVFDWGIQGAAIATNISYLVGTIWVLSHFLQKNTTIKFHKKNFKLEKNIIKSILSIGLSPFSIQLATSFVFVLVNAKLLKYGGDLAIGAFGILNSINTMIIMVIIGLNQGTQPIIGYNYGARSYSRMFRTLRQSIIIATIISTIGFIAGTFFPTSMVSLFSTDTELQRIAAEALQISVLLFPLIGSQIVISNFFQSIGKAKISIFLSLTRQIIFLIPSLLLLPSMFGIKGTWSALPVSDGLAAIVSFATIYLFIKKYKFQENM